VKAKFKIPCQMTLPVPRQRREMQVNLTLKMRCGESSGMLKAARIRLSEEDRGFPENLKGLETRPSAQVLGTDTVVES